METNKKLAQLPTMNERVIDDLLCMIGTSKGLFNEDEVVGRKAERPYEYREKEKRWLPSLRLHKAITQIP